MMTEWARDRGKVSGWLIKEQINEDSLPSQYHFHFNIYTNGEALWFRGECGGKCQKSLRTNHVNKRHNLVGQGHLRKQKAWSKYCKSDFL